MKKLVAFTLSLSLLIGLVPAGHAAVAPASADTAAPAPAPVAKGGYTLAPLAYGKTGVEAASPFTLTTPEDAGPEEIYAALSIDGQPAPAVEQKAAREFLIIPSAMLSHNTIYVFRLSRAGMDDITWAFQTSYKFEVTSNYPRNQATNVPCDSGIEITFSVEVYGPIDDHFNISPHVDGTFAYHGDTAVFMPKALAYQTVYTVTLKAGLSLEATGEALQGATVEALQEAHVFSFETEAEIEHEPLQPTETVSFQYDYAELPTIEPPTIGFSILARSDTAPDPKIGVYKFSSAEEALAALETLVKAPNWSSYAKFYNRIETFGMAYVMEFNAKFRYDRANRTLTLPGMLSQGFYLIDAALGESRSQMIVQITDLPVHIVADESRAIVWVNDITTNKASAGAEVHDAKGGKTYTTNANGVAVIDRALAQGEKERLDIMDATGGKACIWLNSQYTEYYSYYSYYGSSSGSYNSNDSASYWTALQLDRTLFRADDTVSFFGFVQNRDYRNKEDINYVTATLESRYYYRSSNETPLLKQTVQVEDGIYSGEIALPNLDPGYYTLNILHGDVELSSTYFIVREYVKPPYTISVAADKKAVFAGETVTFTASAAFFEGTPLPDLDLSYYVSSGSLLNSGAGTATTDADGKISISQEIKPYSNAQGEEYIGIEVQPYLPQTGMGINTARARAFVNDIDVRANASRTGADATLKINVNTITLDRINSGTAKHYNDYIDKPVGGKSLSVKIYRVYYETVPDGEYYDYYEKKVVPSYKYVRETELIDSFTMLTDKDGAANRNFSVPDVKWESYYAEISCTDSNGKDINITEYIGRDYSSYYRNAATNDYYLSGANDSYSIGEPVAITLMRGADAVAGGNVLFVALQRGIQGWQAGRNTYSATFARKHVPNLTIRAYYFNGYKYETGGGMSQTIYYNYSQSGLTLTADADKESYKPGDTCTVTINARDKDGLAVPAAINISVVDEALFALWNYNVDTLSSLYSKVDAGPVFESATHRLYTPKGRWPDSYIVYDEDVPMLGYINDSYAQEFNTYERKNFKDTAIFETLRTGADGIATYTFTLPDNITSWRLTASGISDDLYAGNSVRSIIVSNPMFINYTLNSEFLVGDRPVIGVNAYGTSLDGGETVEYEVWDEGAPDIVYRAGGSAFERVNIPLWEMAEEGANALVIKATASNGASDSLVHAFAVYKTYREVDAADYRDVEAGIALSGGSGGLTRITFTDRGRGQFLWELISLRRVYGDRLEKLLACREANRLLAEYFPDLILYGGNEDVDSKQYQQDDGGLSILPFGYSDLEATVKLMPYVMDEINGFELKNYLYDIYENSYSENKMAALYGLAMLREPVLLELDSYAMLDALPVSDATYIALGYLALGEAEKAAMLYDSRVAPKLQRLEPYYRVDEGSDNIKILAATSAAAALATKLDRPEKEGLYQYCVNFHAADARIDMDSSIEKLAYIKHEIAKKHDSVGAVTYALFGDERTIELSDGRSHTLTIPSQSIGELEILGVAGDVGAVVSYKAPMTYDEPSGGDLSPDGDLPSDGDLPPGVDLPPDGNLPLETGITIRRNYYKELKPDVTAGSRAGGRQRGGDEPAGGRAPEEASTVFNQGDLVRVELQIAYSATAVDGTYSVTDYLPSGLMFAGDPVKIKTPRVIDLDYDYYDYFGYSYGYFGYYGYSKNEGQKVSFYDYNDQPGGEAATYYYYARVVSPGTYKAEGAFVQSLAALEYSAAGEDATIIID
ncbi:MAG: Ig-like domain-containing protein [Oscillospiraceae bacterium]|nr:Ig-like domain-containing protein [Oscillospiraceae bacterium]